MFSPLVSNISGVQPYKIAHIVFTIDVSKSSWRFEDEKLTVELRLNPIELSMTANVDVTSAKMIQDKAVKNVLPANDHFRPILVFVTYAPTYSRQTLIHHYISR